MASSKPPPPRAPGATSPRVASDASKVLRDHKATPGEKSIAGDALRNAPPKNLGTTTPRVASDASKVLRDPKATNDEKSAAGDALRNARTQKPSGNKK